MKRSGGWAPGCLLNSILRNEREVAGEERMENDSTHWPVLDPPESCEESWIALRSHLLHNLGRGPVVEEMMERTAFTSPGYVGKPRRKLNRFRKSLAG